MLQELGLLSAVLCRSAALYPPKSFLHLFATTTKPILIWQRLLSLFIEGDQQLITEFGALSANCPDKLHLGSHPHPPPPLRAVFKLRCP